VKPPPDQEPTNDLHDLQAVLAVRARQEEQVGHHQRFVERVTRSIGRPGTIYLTLLVAAAWIAFNLAAPRLSLPVLDPPPFSRMQGAIGLAALLMTTMVLTTQNRQARHAEQRSHLDLQVNLLAEKKVAKLIALIEELRRDMPNVHNRTDSLAEAMTTAVDAGAVISVLEENLDAPQRRRDDDDGPENAGNSMEGDRSK
jgi:uncharacterized membrane protein